MQLTPGPAESIHVRRGCARTGARMHCAFAFKPSERDTHSPSIPLTVIRISVGAKAYCENPFSHRFTFSSHAPSFRWTPAVYGARISRLPATDIFVALASSQCSRRLDIAAITDCIGKMPMPRLAGVAGRMPAPQKLRVCTRQYANSVKASTNRYSMVVNKNDQPADTPQNPLIFGHSHEQKFDIRNSSFDTPTTPQNSLIFEHSRDQKLDIRNSSFDISQTPQWSCT